MGNHSRRGSRQQGKAAHDRTRVWLYTGVRFLRRRKCNGRRVDAACENTDVPQHPTCSPTSCGASTRRETIVRRRGLNGQPAERSGSFAIAR
jgi:hypothetical protein